MLSLSARLPKLYAVPARDFCGMSNKNHTLALKCLAEISGMEKGLLRLFKTQVLHYSFGMAFSNFQEMVQHKTEPRQFDMKKYQVALKGQLGTDDLTEHLRLLQQDDWQPGEGDYLGPLHYLFAIERLEKYYQKALSGNDYRRGKSLYLCKHPPFVDLSRPSGNGICDVGNIRINSDDEQSVHQENVFLIAQFLSRFAKVCRCEVRRPGTLDEFMTKAKGVVNDEANFEAIFGFLLYIGKEIFSYYLMLWEAVLTSESIKGEQNTHVRKQPARSFQYP